MKEEMETSPFPISCRFRALTRWSARALTIIAQPASNCQEGKCEKLYKNAVPDLCTIPVLSNYHSFGIIKTNKGVDNNDRNDVCKCGLWYYGSIRSGNVRRLDDFDFYLQRWLLELKIRRCEWSLSTQPVEIQKGRTFGNVRRRKVAGSTPAIAFWLNSPFSPCVCFFFWKSLRSQVSSGGQFLLNLWEY